jgi:biotin carboxyl carrier protein
LLRSDFYERSYVIRIGGETFEVAIQSDLDALIEKMGYELGSSRIMNSIKAPMPGIIIDIPVEPGQQVKEGESLVILEAMKMENAILSPSNATIKDILVKKGDTVEKNKLLIELE